MNQLKFRPVLDKQMAEVNIAVGDTVRVKNTVVEGGKSRIQIFEGVLISLRGRGDNKMMTVRRIGARGVGVERTWPLNSPNIVGIEVKGHAKNVRRSKLYFMRDLLGRAANRI